jgi:hypothetical protein
VREGWEVRLACRHALTWMGVGIGVWWCGRTEKSCDGLLHRELPTQKNRVTDRGPSLLCNMGFQPLPSHKQYPPAPLSKPSPVASLVSQPVNGSMTTHSPW